jgi:hypothetical protein
MVITGRGVFMVSVYVPIIPGVEEQPIPEISVRKADWESVYYLPHNQPDASDCLGVAYHRAITKDDLKALLPKSRHGEVDDAKSYDGSLTTSHSDAHANRNSEVDERKEFISVQIKEQHKRKCLVHTKYNFALDGQEGRLASYMLDDEVYNSIKSMPGFKEVSLEIKETWCGQYCGDILIKDEKSLVNEFTLVPAYAIKRRKYVKGVVTDLIQPQQSYNKVRSTQVESATKGSGTTHYVYPDTFAAGPGGGDGNQSFADNKGKIGSTFLLKSEDSKIPQIEHPAQLSPELSVMERQFREDLPKISGVNEEMMGGGTNSEGGRLERSRWNTHYIFTNLDESERNLAKVLISLFLKVLKPDHIYRIIASEDSNQKSEGGVKIGGVPFKDMDKKRIEELWKQAELMRFDIHIDTVPNTPTKLMEDWQELTHLKGQGVPISMSALIKSHPDWTKEQKEQYLADSNAQVEIENQQNDRKISVEENKTHLAAQSREKIEMAKLQLDQMKIESDRDLAIAKLQANTQIELAKMENARALKLADMHGKQES